MFRISFFAEVKQEMSGIRIIIVNAFPLPEAFEHRFNGEVLLCDLY